MRNNTAAQGLCSCRLDAESLLLTPVIRRNHIHAVFVQVANAAEEYGYHMGLAFQIVDDILDIVGAADVSFGPQLAEAC